MKLSFSTKGWSERSWDELLELAETMDFNGIEVFDVTNNEALIGKVAPFHIYNTAATLRTGQSSRAAPPVRRAIEARRSILKACRSVSPCRASVMARPS